MAIPGMTEKYEPRAKVRIGTKRQTSSGKEYPASLDYFVSDDAEFNRLYPLASKPKTIRIVSPFDEPEQFFSTGLELWRGQMLVCYTKGEQEQGRIVALRKATMKRGDDVIDLLAGETVLDPQPRGQDRRAIVCRNRQCPLFKTQDKTKACRPMGRLQFFLEGGSTLDVLEVDTKAWNSIERMEAVLKQARRRGPLSERVFELSVQMESRGTSRFPVLSIKEADVPITDETLPKADALGAAEAKLAETGEKRAALFAGLDVVSPGWRNGGPVFDAMRLAVEAGSSYDDLYASFVEKQTAALA